MKSRFLIVGILIYIAFLSFYFPNRDEIKEKIHIKLPVFYSSANKDANTVFQMENPIHPSPYADVKPLPNTDFTYTPSAFHIDDTDSLKNLSLSCAPDSFGYSIERGNEVFPPKVFPKCSEVNGQEDTYIHVDREQNLVYMNCPKDKNNKILVGPFDDRKLVPREAAYSEWKVKDYKGPVDASKIEFALGSCESDGDELMQGDMSPIFNKTAYDKAKAKVTSKPRMIFILTLDSLSRRHFFRKLPDVVDFMNSLNENKTSGFSVFDFKLHNVMGGDSPSNQVPIFIGEVLFPRTTPGDQNKDFIGDKAIWKKLRDKGFVSLLGFESCDDNFMKAIGRKPDLEYSVGPFYCATEKFTSNKFGKGYTLQRCLGGHQTHYYILNYTRTVIEMNKGVNLWLYIHLNSGHEGTGQHAATLNTDIKEYLQGLLKKYKDDFDILIFLNADHGMRYGSWYKDLSAFQEQKLPSLFIIASNSLLDQYPYSYNSLWLNTHRLVSKLDYRNTILNISGISEDSNSINLLGEVALKSRTCSDLGINPWDCACLKMTEVSNPDKKTLFMLNKLKDYAEIVINSMSYSDSKYSAGRVCKKIILNKINKIYHTGINNVEELFKLEVSSDTQKDLRFSVTYFLSADGEQMDANKGKFRVESFVYKGHPVKARILMMVRLDQYSGTCEINARTYKVNAQYCACADDLKPNTKL